MRYLPDTNLWVALLRRGGSHRAAVHRLRQQAAADVGMSSVVAAELIAGACKSQQRDANLRRVEELLSRYASVPFGIDEARRAGELRAHLESAGIPIGPYDQQIAATALACSLIVVTHNVREFSRVPGLQVEDWQG